MFPNVPNAPDSATSPPKNPDEPGARWNNESQRFWDMLGKTSTTDDDNWDSGMFAINVLMHAIRRQSAATSGGNPNIRHAFPAATRARPPRGRQRRRSVGSLVPPAVAVETISLPP